MSVGLIAALGTHMILTVIGIMLARPLLNVWYYWKYT